MNIHILLFLILFATIVNLFYKKTAANKVYPSFAITKKNYYDAIQCASMGGFRCDNPHCDCSSICKNLKFEKLNIVDDKEETVFVNGRKLSFGTYCIPKTAQRQTKCNLKSSILLFSASGWLCQNKPYWKGNHRMACKSLHALENASNELVDVFTGLPATDNIDLFETYLNDRGESIPRFRCHCGSLDDRGNRMINATPYTCLPDYCVRQFKNVPGLGWNGQFCECGPFHHADPMDPTSHCVRDVTRHRDGLIHGKVDCTSRDSLHLLPLLCPADAKSLNFTKKVATSNDPLDFVRMHKDAQSSIAYKKILIEESEEPDAFDLKPVDFDATLLHD